MRRRRVSASTLHPVRVHRIASLGFLPAVELRIKPFLTYGLAVENKPYRVRYGLVIGVGSPSADPAVIAP